MLHVHKNKEKVSTVQRAKDMLGLGQHLGACISSSALNYAHSFGVVWQQQLATGNLQPAVPVTMQLD